MNRLRPRLEIKFDLCRFLGQIRSPKSKAQRARCRPVWGRDRRNLVRRRPYPGHGNRLISCGTPSGQRSANLGRRPTRASNPQMFRSWPLRRAMTAALERPIMAEKTVSPKLPNSCSTCVPESYPQRFRRAPKLSKHSPATAGNLRREPRFGPIRRCLANVAHALAVFGRVGPNFSKECSSSTKLGRQRPQLCQRWPTTTKYGPKLANIDRQWSSLIMIRPAVARHGPTRAEFTDTRSEASKLVENPTEIRPNLTIWHLRARPWAKIGPAGSATRRISLNISWVGVRGLLCKAPHNGAGPPTRRRQRRSQFWLALRMLARTVCFGAMSLFWRKRGV